MCTLPVCLALVCHSARLLLRIAHFRQSCRAPRRCRARPSRCVRSCTRMCTTHCACVAALSDNKPCIYLNSFTATACVSRSTSAARCVPFIICSSLISHACAHESRTDCVCDTCAYVNANRAKRARRSRVSSDGSLRRPATRPIQRRSKGSRPSTSCGILLYFVMCVDGMLTSHSLSLYLYSAIRGLSNYLVLANSRCVCMYLCLFYRCVVTNSARSYARTLTARTSSSRTP